MPNRDDQLTGEFPFVPKQLRAQQKRDALLTSGHILFKTKGYEHTTAKEIAARAGVATGTFYRYFSDKRQLLMSLLEDQLDRLMPPEPKFLSQDPESFLADRLEAHVKNLNELGLQRVLPELIHKDMEFAEVLTEARNKIYTRIVNGLRQAREKGITWKDLDLEEVAWSIMILLDKVSEREVRSGKSSDCRAIAKVICRLVFPPEVLVKWRTEYNVKITL